MRHYSLVIEERLVSEVDKLIKEFGLYSSRSDFIRDAIRARLLEIKRMISELAETEDAGEEQPPKQDAPVSQPQIHEHVWKGVH